eukprot:gene10518-11650_t
MIRTLIRILGNTLDSRKKVYIALTRIYGIGISRSKSILKSLNINPDVKVSDLTNENVSNLRDLLENETFQLEGNLKRLLKQNINRLIEIGSYRGKRHLKGLPARGQRTRTNSHLLGNTLCWSSSGCSGLKGARKSTAFAAQSAAKLAALKAADFGIKKIDIIVKGRGKGRESSIRALKLAGLRILSIEDKTRVPFNGCRPPKRRRL